jgi:hypothetical protein
MIGKPGWFTYRTFGWGIAPKTWQGWVYLAAFAALFGFIIALGFNLRAQLWVTGVVLAVLVLDVLHIMVQLPRVHDERENYHQLLIERNCSFAAIVALLAVAVYQSLQNGGRALAGSVFPFDWALVVVLGAMLLAKIGSTAYVKLRL